MQVFVVEFFMTFLFVTFVLQIVKHNGAKDVPINALAIGIALYATIQTASGISGGCINPAVGVVQPIFQRMMNRRIYPNAPTTQLIYQGMYIVGPLFGGIFAGVFQRYVNENAIAKSDTARSQELELTGL